MSLEYEEGREYTVNIGPSISDSQSCNCIAIRCLPHVTDKVDFSKQATIRQTAGDLIMAEFSQEVSPDLITLSGTMDTNTMVNCVILYDKETETFRIETVSNSVLLQHQPLQEEILGFPLALPQHPQVNSSNVSLSLNTQCTEPEEEEQHAKTHNNDNDDDDDDFSDLADEIDRATPTSYELCDPISFMASDAEKLSSSGSDPLEDAIRELDGIPTVTISTPAYSYSENTDPATDFDDLESEFDSVLSMSEEVSACGDILLSPHSTWQTDHALMTHGRERRPISLSAKLGDDGFEESSDSQED